MISFSAAQALELARAQASPAPGPSEAHAQRGAGEHRDLGEGAADVDLRARTPRSISAPRPSSSASSARARAVDLVGARSPSPNRSRSPVSRLTTRSAARRAGQPPRARPRSGPRPAPRRLGRGGQRAAATRASSGCSSSPCDRGPVPAPAGVERRGRLGAARRRGGRVDRAAELEPSPPRASPPRAPPRPPRSSPVSAANPGSVEPLRQLACAAPGPAASGRPRRSILGPGIAVLLRTGFRYSTDRLAIFAGLRHDAAGRWLAEAGPGQPHTAARGRLWRRRRDRRRRLRGHVDRARAAASRPRSAHRPARGRGCGDGPSGRNAGFANSLLAPLRPPRAAHGRRAARSSSASSPTARSTRSASSPRERGARDRVSQGGPPEGLHQPRRRTTPGCRRCGPARLAAAPADGSALDAAGVRARCDSPLFRSGAFVATGRHRAAGAARPGPARGGRRGRGRRRASAPGRAGSSPAAAAGRDRDRSRRPPASAGGGVRDQRRRPPAFAPCGARLAVTSTHMIVTEPVPDLLEAARLDRGRVHLDRAALPALLPNHRRRPDRIRLGRRAARLRGSARRPDRGRRHDGSSGCAPTSCGSSPASAGAGSTPRGAGRSTSRRPNCPASEPSPASRIHYVCGFTGNGVGPAHLAGDVLASLALGRRRRAHPLGARRARAAAGTARAAALPRWHAWSAPRSCARRTREDAGRRRGPADPARDRDPGRLGIHVGR